MLRFGVSLLLLVSLVGVSLQQADKNDPELDYNNPIRSSADDEVKNLPGLNDPIGFRQYSGYLQADDKGKKFFHYWFIESQGDPSKDPVMLWLNGGPGCSSMEGLFAELGPFELNADGKTLKMRAHSWNKHASVLFLESPAGVGFSYSTRLVNVHTDDSTARENHLALRSFFKKFPQYKTNQLFLAGESYAGVYLPTLGVLVDQDPEMNLKGIAIGNGYLDASKLTDSLIFFAYHHGFMGKSKWDQISKECCGGQPPSRQNCNFSGKKTTFVCQALAKEVMMQLDFSGINMYNVYADCAGAGGSHNLTQSPSPRLNHYSVEKNLVRIAADPETYSGVRPFVAVDNSKLRVEPPCTDEHLLANYLNSAEVRQAINIPKRVGAWDICATLIYHVKYPLQEGGLAPQINQLIDSKRRLRLMVYNGDVDAVCNFLGDEWFVDDLGRKVIKDYSIWRVDNQVAGFVKHYDGITFVTVRGSGHMVPQDRPREAEAMIQRFLGSNGTSALDLVYHRTDA